MLLSEATSAAVALGELRYRAQAAIDSQRRLWRAELSSWVIVPMSGDDQVVWRVAFTDPEARRRAEEVATAFIGPALGRVNRTAAASHSGYATSAIALHGSHAELLDVLEMLVAVRAGEPVLPSRASDPLALLLRDFRLALAAADAESSGVLLQRVEAAGLLSRDNIRFLKLERLARLSRWTDVARLPWLVDLAKARVPRYIAEFLLEALWWVHFGDAAVTAVAGQGLRHFEGLGLQESHRALLDAVDVPSRPVARRVAWLSAALSEDTGRQERVRAASSADERDLLDLLVRSPPPTPVAPVEQTPAARARELFDNGEFGSAVAFAETHPTVAPVVAVAVRAAYELADPELAVRAVSLVSPAIEADLPRTAGFLRDLAHVRALAANGCSGWIDWLDRVAQPAAWLDAAQVARAAAEGWPIAELSSAVSAGRAANLLVAGIDGPNDRQVAAVLDLLCELGEGLARLPGCEAFLDAVLLALAAQENLSNAVRGAFVALVVDIFAAAPDAARYREVVELSSDLWSQVRSVEALNWALDLLDVFAVSPSPEPGTRASFALAVGTGVLPHAARVAPHQRTMLLDLAAECGVTLEVPQAPPPDPSDPTADPWAKLASRLVGLYSLLDGIGVRFRKRLLSLNASVSVEHNADTVATAALRSLARSADYLVVDTRHAAHQATGAIDEVRPRQRQLFPSGRGLSSFIDRLREELEAIA